MHRTIGAILIARGAAQGVKMERLLHLHALRMLYSCEQRGYTRAPFAEGADTPSSS